MHYTEPLLEARFLRRYQRFLADFELEGRTVTAHCANPGSMLTCLEPGAKAWLSPQPNPARKLPFTWELVNVGGVFIQVNPLRANSLVAEAIGKHAIPSLAGYPTLRREVRYGESSRVDFLLQRGKQCCYVEVKSVTLSLGQGRAAFPDAVSKRASRHVDELIRMRQLGHRAVLLFAVSRSDATSVEPAAAIDPRYTIRLRQAASHGVEVLAYAGAIGPGELSLVRAVPVRLK